MKPKKKEINIEVPEREGIEIENDNIEIDFQNHTVSQKLIPGPKGDKGDAGIDGKTPTEKEILSIIQPKLPKEKDIVEKVLKKMPKPKDGKDGKGEKGEKGEKGDTLRFSDLTPYEKQILTGPQGSNGVGVPRGGTDGQILSKSSSRDFDTEWIDNSGGGAVDSVNGQTGAVSVDLQSVTDEGATTTDAITTGGLTTPYTQFDIAATPIANAEGLMQWNPTDGTIDLGMSGGDVTMQIGQEMFIKVRNVSGSTITNGTPVYVNGRTGNRPNIYPARSDSESTSTIIGLTTQDITSPSDGFVTTFGYVRQIKTNYSGSGNWGTTWAEGDNLYVSKTIAGQLTNVEPSVPHSSDIVGTVAVVGGAGIGSILVINQKHQSLQELSDVNGTPLDTTGQIPVWNNTAGYFDFTSNITDYFNKTTDDTDDITEGATNLFMDSTEQGKLSNITVTQAVNLDTMESDIAALANGMVYKGNWDASAGTFPGAGAAEIGWFYTVSIGGTVDSVVFNVGDRLIAIADNASTSTYAGNWTQLDATDAVTSIFSRTGNVVSANGDYTASQITNVPAGNIAATEVQAALNELDGDKQATLVSGTNIKTVNSTTLLGSGDIAVATTAQGALADSALQPSDIASGTITARADDINFSGGIDGDVLTVQADGSLALEAAAGGGANTALSNLASVAINTTLVSDTDNTDDLGTTLIKWANLFVTTIGATATRVTKGWFTDLEVTNAIAGSVTGNAGTATTLATPRAIYGNNFDGSAALTQVIASTYGGTGNGFTKISGPTTAEKTITIPDADMTITAAAATVLDDTTVGAMVDTLGGATSTGTGGLVRATSPTLVTPALGTPASGVLTNCTGLPTAGLVDDAVSLAKMASGTAGNLITYDASGNPAAVATGTATHVLTSNGAGAAPTFQAVSVAGGSWAELASVTLSGTAVSIDSGTITAKKELMVYFFATGKSATSPVGVQFNADTAGNYSWQLLRNATSGTAQSATSVGIQNNNNTTDVFCVLHIHNATAAGVKMGTVDATEWNGTAAGAMLGLTGKFGWADTTNQITSIQVIPTLGGGITFNTGSYIKVYGRD